MIIEVTQEDIDAGIKKNCTKCPIALAVQRAFKNSSLEIGGLSVYQDCHKVCEMPYEARVFVQCFDDGKPVNPFTFELHI